MEFMNRIWEKEDWPEECRVGIIALVLKKDEGNKMVDYRKVPLMLSLFKVCTAILAERLRKEVKDKRIILRNQTGFRKGMNYTKNIYIY